MHRTDLVVFLSAILRSEKSFRDFAGGLVYSVNPALVLVFDPASHFGNDPASTIHGPGDQDGL